MTTETTTKQQFCYDERHNTRCPLPCLACEADGCDYGQAPTSTATHTPTPWRVDGCEPIAIVQGETVICYVKQFDESGADAVDRANAAFIVRAVNSQGSLVEALHDADVFLGTLYPFVDADIGLKLDALHARFAAALKLAEVEEGR